MSRAVDYGSLHIIVTTAFVDGDSPRLIAGFSLIHVMLLAGSLLVADYPPPSVQHKPASYKQGPQ